jgi:chemotaxis protein MotB
MVPPSPAAASGPLNEGKTSGQSAQIRLKATHSEPGAIGANTTADAGAGDNTPGAKATADGATDKTAKDGPVDEAKANLPKDNADSAEQLDAEIKETLRQAGIPDLPDIKVERKSDGLLISITDNLNFEMFTLSSATPRPELVVAMEKIGKLLQARAERIIVRGHTDARQFRSGTYDNWRLSSDRAHIVHYMLARGGLPEKRFERIEGYADRELKMPGDPKAASNRRIEILLRQPMP